jgi:hypothetical protein
MQQLSNRWIRISIFLLFLIAFSNGAYCIAAVNQMSQDLPDDYLGSEFAWTMILNLPDTNYYLNYQGSKLWPVTKVEVYSRTYRQDGKPIPPKNTLYEEFWYHKQVPLGLRRHTQIVISPQTDGALIVCPAESCTINTQRPPAIANALIRLLVDVQFRNSVIGLVLVPRDEYEGIADALAQYNFFPPDGTSHIRPISIHMRGYPDDEVVKDDIFYLQNQT